MADRAVISYDDITLPYDPIEAPAPAPKPNGQPLSKKRKKSNQKAKQWANSGRSSNNAKSASNSQRAEFNGHVNAHSGGNNSHSKQGQHVPEAEEDWEGAGDEGEYLEEESRELTHEEIWDDSALVGAWESAMEEYKAYHGPKDDWKKEPPNKSSLWYNVPVDLLNIPIPPTTAAQNESEENSQSLDFDTFVPTHDASLPPSKAPPPKIVTADYTTDTPGAVVSRDEAFSRAMSAMYWSGYWTAMYHAQSQNTTADVNSYAPTEDPTEPGVEAPNQEQEENENENQEEDEEMEGDEEGDEFTPTQR